jgi:hypothetical protein
MGRGYLDVGRERVLAIALAALTACAGGGEATTTSTEPPATAPTTTASTTTTSRSLPEPITSEGAATTPIADLEETRLQLLGGPDWLAVGFGSLWVRLDRGVVLRINPEGNSIDAEVSVTSQLCQGLGASPEAIWTCSREVDQPIHVARIDPSTNEVVATVEVGKSPDQGRLVYANDRIWIISGLGDQILGIDPTTNTLGPPIDLGTRCTDLAAAGDALWAVCPIEGVVVRVDPSGEVTRGSAILENARQIAASEFVFVGFDGGLAQLDPDSLDVLAVYDVAPGLGGGVWADSAGLWVRRDPGPFLTRVDPISQTVVELIEAEAPFSAGDIVGAFGSIWATAYNDKFLVRLSSG